MKNIFDWLKQINTIKSPSESFSDKDWEIWNSYMIHRFISMNPEFVEIANYVQEIPPQEKSMIYNIYKEYIPKNNKWNKYIKSKAKPVNKDLVEHLKTYFKVSSREILDYLKILDNKEINIILSKMGIEEKLIKQLL
tara:strand:- start:6 stop:416 length:411 start_codon:yes stop_codon:yes gene_type:complete